MIRVEFQRTKRYPHPSGPKRSRGTVLPIDDATAAAWARAGLVTLVDRPAELDQLTVAGLRDLAALHRVDLKGASKKADIIAVITAAWNPAAPATRA